MIGERFETDIGIVQVRSTDRSDGSFSLAEPRAVLEARRARVLGEAERTWVGLRQVHGATVVDASTVDIAGHEASADTIPPPEADASITYGPAHALGVLTADCAPLVLVGSIGVAAVHAGWRGAAEGIIDRAATTLRDAGDEAVATFLGPCIQPGQYEFGPAELDEIAGVFGPEVVARTTAGRPALDLTRVVQLSCERAGWPVPPRPACTSDPAFFSHRTRRDTGRQTTVAWIETVQGDRGGAAADVA